MAEFDLDSESVSRAKRLTSRLLNELRFMVARDSSPESIRQLFSEQRYAEEREMVPINDVLRAVSRMAIGWRPAMRFEEGIACVALADGDLAPVSLETLVGGPRFPPIDIEFLSAVLDRHRYGRVMEIWQQRQRRDERFRVISLSDATEAVESSLSQFLAYRFAGTAAWYKERAESKQPLWLKVLRALTGGSPPGGGGRRGGLADESYRGLRVRVSCQASGLRLHVSPAYFIDWVFFGAPTTPVSSYVLPGRYIFAGDGPMLTDRVIDTGVFAIPPNYELQLAGF